MEVSDCTQAFSLLARQERVGQEVLERYLALEEEIAAAEQGSPTMVLEHKRAQIDQLDQKIADQHALLQKYETET